MTRQQQIWEADNHYRELGAKFNTFENGAKWADAHPAWIDIKEEQPTEENLYIVSNGQESSVAYWIENHWDIFNDEIRYWMSLPISPEKQETIMV